ncbi:MAG: hypothetical protein KKE11_01305 [Gammaproteobacteria bacterium]|nr:hypothetical protein [Gammaproteobacteria bacterium]
MRPEWYGDKRDLLKWAVLYHIAAEFNSDILLQVAFFRESKYSEVRMNGKERDIPKDILSHFRNLYNIYNMNFKCEIHLFDELFDNRGVYLKALLKKIIGYKGKRKIIFLDPDTGLEPQKTKSCLKHVLEDEVKKIWEAMDPKDVLVVYQHKTNMAGEPWKDSKREQLAKTINTIKEAVKIAQGPKIADDVVFFYVAREK